MDKVRALDWYEGDAMEIGHVHLLSISHVVNLKGT